MAMRWDPFQDAVSLSDAVNRLMQDAVMRPGFSIGRIGEAPMNVIEHNDRYFVQVALPGVKPEDAEITSQQSTLTIKAKRFETLPSDVQGEHKGYLLAEFGPGEYIRSITLPKDFEAEHIEASFDRGVLTIVIPIAQHAQPRRIQVREQPSAKQLVGTEEDHQAHH